MTKPNGIELLKLMLDKLVIKAGVVTVPATPSMLILLPESNVTKPDLVVPNNSVEKAPESEKVDQLSVENICGKCGQKCGTRYLDYGLPSGERKWVCRVCFGLGCVPRPNEGEDLSREYTLEERLEDLKTPNPEERIN